MAKRKLFTDEEHELICQRAHVIWKARSDDGKMLWDLLQLLVVPLTMAIVVFSLQKYAYIKQNNLRATCSTLS